MSISRTLRAPGAVLAALSLGCATNISARGSMLDDPELRRVREEAPADAPVRVRLDDGGEMEIREADFTQHAVSGTLPGTEGGTSKVELPYEVVRSVVWRDPVAGMKQGALLGAIAGVAAGAAIGGGSCHSETGVCAMAAPAGAGAGLLLGALLGGVIGGVSAGESGLHFDRDRTADHPATDPDPSF